MDNDEHLERHLELCRRVYLRMLAEGTLPWRAEQDSQNSPDVVESEDTTNDV